MLGKMEYSERYKDSYTSLKPSAVSTEYCYLFKLLSMVFVGWLWFCSICWVSLTLFPCVVCNFSCKLVFGGSCFSLWSLRILPSGDILLRFLICPYRGPTEFTCSGQRVHTFPSLGVPNPHGQCWFGSHSSWHRVGASVTQCWISLPPVQAID